MPFRNRENTILETVMGNQVVALSASSLLCIRGRSVRGLAINALARGTLLGGSPRVTCAWQSMAGTQAGTVEPSETQPCPADWMPSPPNLPRLLLKLRAASSGGERGSFGYLQGRAGRDL